MNDTRNFYVTEPKFSTLNEIKQSEDILSDDKPKYSDFTSFDEIQPEKYFETKFERPVMFDEFVAVVVPENTPADVVNFLRSQGLQIETYEADNDASRKAAMQKATQQEGVRFKIEIGDARTTDEQKKSTEERQWTDAESQTPGALDMLTADSGLRFKVRIAAPPKKTRIGYKVFVLKDGKLYPPMVANADREETPVGIWLDADANEHFIIGGKENVDAEFAHVEPWLRRYKVKSGGKGTQGGSSELAYRPGWHLGEIPMALQFDRENLDKPVLDEDGNPVFDKRGKQKFVKDLFPANFVWAEVECAADEDYQSESDERMWYDKNGKRFKNPQHAMGGLNHVPENGLYMYRTNPDPKTDPWIITGAMKVNRILKPSEVDQMIKDAGRIPQERQEGAVTDEQVDELNQKHGLNASRTRFRTLTPNIGADSRAMAQAQYEARVRTSGFQVQEALQDSMLGLRAAYDAIEASAGRKRQVWEIRDDENAYTFENRMSSMNLEAQKS